MATNEEIADKHSQSHYEPPTRKELHNLIIKVCAETRADERNKLKEVLKTIRDDCQISEHTHLCVRRIPKTDEELISQLRGAQANIIRVIERKLCGD